MNSNFEDPSLLAGKIAEAEARLDHLEQAIAEIGHPANYELKRRFAVLKIEGHALKRNFEESQNRGMPHDVRLEKIEALLHHIDREESSVAHEAGFLHQAAPSSMTFAIQTGAHLVDLARRGVKAVLGEHHPLGESAFVNHSRANLETEFGLPHAEEPTTPPER